MAWPAAQTEAIKPLASSHQFILRTSLSPSAAVINGVAQAGRRRWASFGGSLELDKSGVEPDDAMGFHHRSRQPVVPKSKQRPQTVRLEHELDGRLAGRQAFHPAPGEHHPSMRNDLKIGSLDRESGRIRGMKHAARTWI